MKRHLILAALVCSTVILAAGCKKKDREAVDLTGIHTTAATERETMASTTQAPTEPETTEAETTSQETETKDGEKAKVSASIKTLEITNRKTGANISVQYPEIQNLSDASRLKQVNELLLNNATAYFDQMADEDLPDSAKIQCEVKSVDINRITAVYKGTVSWTGAAYPTNVFYTNTVDLNQARSLGCNDYSDGYTKAGYLMSDVVKFVSADLASDLLEYRASQSVELYTELFNQADFPLKAGSDGTTVFPESFSYTDKGELYYSIPVPHALGD